MKKQEEAVIEQIYRLMERLVSPIILTVRDKVNTTAVPDETNHIFSVNVDAPKSKAQFTVFWGPVPEEPDEIPGRLISNILFELNKENSQAFNQYNCSPEASKIKPGTLNIAFEIDKSKAISKVEKNVFESIREEILGRVAGVVDSIFVLEVVIERDKAQVIIAPYEGKGEAAKVFEVFASQDLRMPGLIIQKVLNDAIINHFIGDVMKFEVKTNKGILLDMKNIPREQGSVIVRRTK